MVLDKLGSSLKNILKKIARAGTVDKKLIEELVKEIQKALLYADVNVKLVFELTNKIKERALNEKVPTAVTQKEYLINIVYEELVKFLGEEKIELNLKNKSNKILFVGLYGSGKTTTISKLGKYYQNRGKKVAFLALDVHRPAAIDQLEQLGNKLKIKVFSDRKEKNPVKIYKEFKEELNKFDLVLIDTAGRDALSKELVKEIEELNKEIKPDERLLVISADIGQAAEKQAKQFHESVNITGVIASKMDGTAKAGGALVACAVSGAKIKFIGVGEKVDDLEEFNPKGFVGRLLGMGDLEALLEKAKVAIDEEKAEDLGKKLLKGEFNFLDLYEQVQAMNKLGPLNKILDLIPGMGNLNIPKEMLDVQEGKLEKWKYIMQSMTKKELEDPEIIDSNRIERIAKGSGATTGEVRELLKQYRQAKKLMKVMKGKDPSKLMKKFKGKFPGF
ncbi:MAG: signal recognition particle protein Srp54 [Nanoarchaeota archaeon]